MDEKLKKAMASVVESGNRDAIAELIVEYVGPDHITTDFIGMMLNTRNLKPGDALVKKTRKGIKVRTLVPGSVHLASEVTTSERMNYILDGADVKVTYNEWDIENGDIGSVQEIKSEMLAKLKDFYLTKVFTALTDVWTEAYAPDNYTDVGGVITATALEDAIDQINLVTPGAKLVVGSRAAMTPITKFAGFWSDGTNVTEIPTQVQEILERGQVGKYYGVPLLFLDQVYDNPDDYNAISLPADKILVIGENAGEFITYGDAKWKQWTDMNPTPPQWMVEVYQQFGMIIDNAQGVYVLSVTTS